MAARQHDGPRGAQTILRVVSAKIWHSCSEPAVIVMAFPHPCTEVHVSTHKGLVYAWSSWSHGISLRDTARLFFQVHAAYLKDFQYIRSATLSLRVGFAAPFPLPFAFRLSPHYRFNFTRRSPLLRVALLQHVETSCKNAFCNETILHQTLPYLLRRPPIYIRLESYSGLCLC